MNDQQSSASLEEDKVKPTALTRTLHILAQVALFFWAGLLSTFVGLVGLTMKVTIAKRLGTMPASSVTELILGYSGPIGVLLFWGYIGAAIASWRLRKSETQMLIVLTVYMFFSLGIALIVAIGLLSPWLDFSTV